MNCCIKVKIFTSIFPEGYGPPDGFSFEVNDQSPPLQDDLLLFDYNVQERIDDFVSASIIQANVTRTNHIMWTMGTDFQYQYANTWFKEMDKFIHYVNKKDKTMNRICEEWDPNSYLCFTKQKREVLKCEKSSTHTTQLLESGLLSDYYQASIAFDSLQIRKVLTQKRGRGVYSEKSIMFCACHPWLLTESFKVLDITEEF
eukprot:Gb_01738 [translate_table: standard]